MKLFLSVVSLALSTLRENKVRSFLTVLGVIIGVGTIVGVGSILAGLDGAVTGLIRSMGSNTAMVFKMRMMGAGRTTEELQRKPITYENALAIEERCPSVQHVSPYLLPPNVMRGAVDRVRYKGNDYAGPNLFGSDEEYAQVSNVEMLAGRFFTDSESQHRMPVVVIGEDIWRAMFGLESALGKNIEVDGHEVEVTGVMKRPTASIPGQDDNRIILPYFTMRKMFPTANEHLLMVQAKEGKLPAAIDELSVVLRQQRHVPLTASDNFAVSTADQMVEQFRALTSVTALVMVVLSSIGLLVGGIGVMNIMLVSVTERTREIGIRKAIGARRSDIILQFLTEAVVLTGLGGMCGMIAGYMISFASRLAFPTLPSSVPLWAAGLGLVVSIGIGLFFGIWPASKAARLDPVEALRYE